MATCTHGAQTGSSVDGATFALPNFTPVANDLLFYMCEVTGNNNNVTVASTGNTAAWTKVTKASFTSNANTAFVFVQNALATATLTGITVTTSPNGTGCCHAAVRVSGLSRSGISAVRQSAVVENLSTTTTVQSPTFGSACLTGNPTIELAGNSNGDTYQPPTNWTEGAADTTITTPSSGFVYHFRNSGFTGTNIGWADTVGFSPTLLGIIAFEIDTSAVPTDTPPLPLVVDTAVGRASSY